MILPRPRSIQRRAGVFVTEAFAAQLSLEGTPGIHCSYVGTTSLAKSHGRVRLLTLS